MVAARDFFLTQEIVEENLSGRYWSGLSDEAIERISEGTAPLLFDREIDLMPVFAEFDVYLDELERKHKEQKGEKKNWQF